MRICKKLFCLILVFCLISSFSGCGKAKPKNYIETMNLSDDQKDIVDLISLGDQKIILYDLKTKETFKHLEFWVETYNKGELVDKKATSLEMFLEPVDALDAEFAVIINSNPDFQWTLIYGKNGGGTTSTSEPNKNYLPNSGAKSYLNKPVEIEDGKEIVLYAAFFKEGAYRDYNDLQVLLDTNNLKQYEYAHLIKCRFSK